MILNWRNAPRRKSQNPSNLSNSTLMIYIDVHETSALILMLSKMSILKEIFKCKKILKLDFRSDS